jgi:hypothetical protein
MFTHAKMVLIPIVLVPFEYIVCMQWCLNKEWQSFN